MTNKPPDVRRIVKRRMKKIGMSTYRLQRETGVSRTSLYMWLAGKRRTIELAAAERIMGALGLTPTAPQEETADVT